MRTKSKKTGRTSFNNVLPVGTVLYRFAKSPSLKFVCETIVFARYEQDEVSSFTYYKTDKGTFLDNDFIGCHYFLSTADALRHIAKENNINVRITERVTQS